MTNVHLYENHLEAVDEQLSREPIKCKSEIYIPDGFTLDTIFDYTASDFLVEGYESHGSIKAPMAF